MRGSTILAGTRNTQLDGWRAFAVIGVMCQHWVPAAWRGGVPFEIGLYFFLTLTGFLIARVLFKEKRMGEEAGGTWRKNSYGNFLKRRIVRITIPCYAAMLFALAVRAYDITHHPFIYFAHLSNFHMAFLHGWPSGTAHYWTLAIQMQFYVLFPLLVFLTPARWMKQVLVLFVLIAPLSRWILDSYFPGVIHSQAITTSAFDYFGVGALLALAMERGMKPGDRRLALASWIALVGYLIAKIPDECGYPVPVLRYFQQTLISVVFAGLISGTLAGFRGLLGKALDHPAIQHLGRISYSLYLFHTPVPILLGYTLPFLWHPAMEGPMLVFRLAAYFLVSWGISYLSWKYLEKGFNKRAA